MTDGQQRALWQLKLIAQKQPGVFDIETVHPPANEDSRLRVVVSLRVGKLATAPSGVRLRAREEFRLYISPDFPFTKPDVYVDHLRFAGMPHVQWAKYLCLYQSSTEWNASDGMFGLLQRLCDWLSKAAANELDPDGQPLHPPAVYVDYAKGKLVVPHADTPSFSETCWLGVAELREYPNRLEIVGWHTPKAMPAEGKFALALLFKSEWPWEYPDKGDALFREFEKQGVPSDLLLRLLAVLASDGMPDSPLFLIVGTPMRGIAGGARKQHLAVWSLNSTVKKGLALTLPKVQDTLEQTSIRAEVRQLVDDHLRAADLTWCQIMEARAEVTVRRDTDSSLARLRGRAIAIWGCGALGAPIALALCRAGVSRLVLADYGQVSPGLLVRQPYRADDVGSFKVDALEAQLKSIRSDLVVEKHCSNVNRLLAAGADWSSGCDLIVDATASEVVRKRTEQAWNRNRSVRVPLASLVVDATSSRLLVTFTGADASGASWDVFRKTKIELLRRGRKDFADAFFPETSSAKMFQPEPGCSEPTFQGSAADAAAMAAIGLNLIAQWLNESKPSTQHSTLFAAPRTGGSIKPSPFFEFLPDVVISAGHHELRVAPGVLKEIRGWIEQNRRLRSRTVETGGLLWGEWDDASQVVWISDASGPPEDSQHSPELFVCGQEGTTAENTARQKHTRGAVQYLGMWHTHPVSRPMPSEIDYEGMAQILSTGPTSPTKNLLLILGRTLTQDVLGAFVFVRELNQGTLQTLSCMGNHFPLKERIL
ncbi:ThiF family adenylyltransferase [Luteolibacter soli]|uniref:ThiF family adenylyltransferase n=1 Tax=Luteolibacter soli TaxID=3135280 RepID=A0ABU9AU88_9BACT